MNRRRLIVGAVIATAVLLAAVPALAHFDRAWHGSDYAEVNSGHTTIKACDGEVDGNQVRAWWRWQAGADSAGSWAPSQGCVTNTLPSYALQYRICEHNASCSDYRNK